MDDSISQQDRHRKTRPRATAVPEVAPIKEYVEKENQGEKLDTWKNGISAKEKTGVDPLSQVGCEIIYPKF